ncbi:MAG: HDOD domain-containing protein [Deltaproteobacteria bacterium]|nr:HDOD domain-containing protein [Deltaproteobacteria bacterium]
MARLVQRKKTAYCHPALQGLSDKELVSLYNTTAVTKLAAGEPLVIQGDTDERVFLILEGSARVRERSNGLEREVSVLHRGDVIPGASSYGRGARPATVVAAEPLSALVLDENDLNVVSPRVHAAIYKNLYDHTQKRLDELVVRQKALSVRSKRLASAVLNLIQIRSGHYEESEMIRGMIQHIPRLPMYANRLAVVILDENVSTRDVAELAKLDPSLVSVVLKTVNSAYYGFKRKISDFQHAVLLLGFNQVYQLVMDVGIRSTMPKTPEFRELLLHSMLVSFIGFEISQLVSVKKAVSVSTVGLLHDIGRSVVLLLKGKHPKMGFLIDMLDQARLGALLLKQWNIPDLVCRTLEYQDYPFWLPPEYIPEKHRSQVSILYLAHLCYEYLKGRPEKTLKTAFLADYFRFLKRPERSLSEFVDRVVLPSLKKKSKTFPEEVRAFLNKEEDEPTGEGLQT